MDDGSGGRSRPRPGQISWMHSYLVGKVTAPIRTLENGASENMGEEAESIQKETPSDELSERLVPQTSTLKQGNNKATSQWSNIQQNSSYRASKV